MYLAGQFVRRILQGVVVVLITTFLIFSILRIVPGDPVRLIVGGMAPDNLVEEIAQKMGLRDPIPIQFGRYLSEVVKGDLGNSYQRPKNGMMGQGGDFTSNMDVEMAEVSDLIFDRLPYTLQLAGMALLISLIVSLPLGISAGLRPKGFMSKIAFFVSSVFVSIPNFWLAIVLALLITIKLGWLPSIGYQNFAYTILPAIVLAVETCPFIIRTISVSFAEISQEYYIKSGKVRGLTRNGVIYRHTLRNASIPLLNLLGIQLSTLLGGVIVVEYIFDYPGLGQLTIYAVLQRDFPLIQGIAMVTSALYVGLNIVVDLITYSIDPRLES
jgi:ABC-type dipeptide/oligopeptide/nickel transport system permease component